jgi:hypothetical protein
MNLRKFLVANLTLLASIIWAPEVTAQKMSNRIIKPARRMDLSKAAIEQPLKHMIKSGSTQIEPRRPDVSKLRIEAPLKSIMKTGASPDLNKSFETKMATNGQVGKPQEPAPLSVANHRVTPGLVSWHKNMATAMKSASKSGKPLLVFHMMGSLDDRFC